MIRILAVFLVAILIFVWYLLFIGDNGLTKYLKLKHQIVVVENQNKELAKQNAALYAKIDILKKNPEATESKARSDLGMVKKGETFYQIVK
jgi:cell division protein FtsB